MYIIGMILGFSVAIVAPCVPILIYGPKLKGFLTRSWSFSAVVRISYMWLIVALGVSLGCISTVALEHELQPERYETHQNNSGNKPLQRRHHQADPAGRP